MYLGYQNGKIKFYVQEKFETSTIDEWVETDEEYILNSELTEYILKNETWEAEQAQKERERIEQLTMTKRIFALLLKEYGITYSQLKELIATNEDAQLEWDLCGELLRSNPLLDIMAAKMDITPKQLDDMFKYANGELNELPIKQDGNSTGEASDETSNEDDTGSNPPVEESEEEDEETI